MEIRLGRPKKKRAEEENIAETDIISAGVGGGIHAASSEDVLHHEDTIPQDTKHVLTPPTPPPAEVKVDPRLKFFADNYAGQFQDLQNCLLYAVYCELYAVNEQLQALLRK